MTSEHEPLLFDLPRNEAVPGGRPPVGSRSGQLQLGDLPLDVRRAPSPKVVSIDPERCASAGRAAAEASGTRPSAALLATTPPQPAPVTDGGVIRRLAAALVSGAFQAGCIGLTVLAAWRLLQAGAVGAGGSAGSDTPAVWPAAALFALLWSLASVVLPLAFFRRTVGMALCGLTATSLDRGPLSFAQATRRWLGGLVTVALFGLPGLLALGGRSFSDRLSGSRSVRG